MDESTSVVIYDPRQAGPEVVALAGFLAGYSGRIREAYTLVNGHGDLPTDGHENSPRTATRSPRGWPLSLPRDGHENSPRTATFSPRPGQVSGVTPLPARASASRTDSPSVTMT